MLILDTIALDPVLIVAAAWATVILTTSTLFTAIQNIHDVFQCPMCVGTWVGLGIGVLDIFLGRNHQVWAISVPVYAMCVSMAATFLNGLANKALS